jgi:hypothetical protein
MKSWTHVKLAKLFSALYRGVVRNAGIVIILKIISYLLFNQIYILNYDKKLEFTKKLQF